MRIREKEIKEEGYGADKGENSLLPQTSPRTVREGKACLQPIVVFGGWIREPALREKRVRVVEIVRIANDGPLMDRDSGLEMLLAISFP